MSDNNIKKPLIIISTGRGGSTILYRQLSRHPSLAWTSSLSNRYPGNPKYNQWLMQMLEWPLLGPILQRKINPIEAYDFWDKYCKGFRRPFRDLRAADVTLRNKEKFLELSSAMLTGKKTRLLLKFTGWPRIGYLKEIFPDAKFVHIFRDGRAMTSSLLEIGFWKGWEGPSNWRWGELSGTYLKLWEKYDRSFVALAAIQWLILMDALEETKKNIHAENYLEVKYEDLCSNRDGILREICDFADLEFSKAYLTRLSDLEMQNKNSNWRRYLTLNQQEIVSEILCHRLEEYGYID